MPLLILGAVILVLPLWLVSVFIISPVVIKKSKYFQIAQSFLTNNHILIKKIGTDMKFNCLTIPGALWGDIRNLKIQATGSVGTKIVHLVIVENPPLSDNWKVSDAWIASADGKSRESLLSEPRTE